MFDDFQIIYCVAPALRQPRKQFFILSFGLPPPPKFACCRGAIPLRKFCMKILKPQLPSPSKRKNKKGEKQNGRERKQNGQKQKLNDRHDDGWMMERDFLVPFVGQPSRAVQTSAERTSEAASQKSALRSVTNGPGKFLHLLRVGSAQISV